MTAFQKAHDHLLNQQQQWQQKTQEYTPIIEMAQIAKGENKQKTSLEAFMLAYSMMEIIKYANMRLSILSEGRYSLQVSSDKKAGGAYSGLDLEVTDTYTGSTRTVESLSGGETFLTSLSLALALSDVIAEHSGGYQMDALFVDEGFGTLDSDKLELALQTLTGLNSGSRRMVGIISHVETLKERVPARVQIAVSQAGSTLSVKV